MNPKLIKINSEIDRTREKIAELQELLPKLENRRTELENFEIIKLVRSANIAPGELSAFVDEYRGRLTGKTAPISAVEDSETSETGTVAGSGYIEDETL